MTLRIGSLCSGYEGLGMAVQAVTGGELAWVADNDSGASKILAHRFPGVPNLGDITAVDWSQIEPVDVLCAGFPCQDVSAAGARAGLRHGTRSGIWHHVSRAIAELRPQLVLIENVRGLLTARGDEPTAGHLAAEASRDAAARLLIWLGNEHSIAIAKGDRQRARNCAARTARVMGARKRAVARCQWHERRLVRAIGTVLGSLAGLGFDAEWTVRAASDDGACHERKRVFVIAWPADAAALGRHDRDDGSDQGTAGQGGPAEVDAGGSGRAAADACREPVQRRGIAGVLAGAERPAARTEGQRERDGDASGDSGAVAEDPDCPTGGERRQPAPGQAESGRPRADAGRSGRALAAADTAGGRRQGRGREGGEGAAPVRLEEVTEDGDSGTATPADAESDGRHEGRTEPARVVGRSDAPECGDGLAADTRCDARPEDYENFAAAARSGGGTVEWGIYEPAIRRWERVLGRPAPRPTEPGRTGERLSPRFVEWMQGLPEGWVTGVPGLSRNEMLKALGNGVVPQCAAAACSLLLAAWSEAMAA